MTETKQHTFQHIPTSHNADFGAIWDERRKGLLGEQDQKPRLPAKRSFHVHKTRPIVPHVALTSVVALDIPPAYSASPCLPYPLPITNDFTQHPMTRSSRHPGTRRNAAHTPSPLIYQCIPEPTVSGPSTPLMASWNPLMIRKVRIPIPPSSHTPIPSPDMSAMLQDIDDFANWMEGPTHPEKENLHTLPVSLTASASRPHTLKRLENNVGSSTSTYVYPCPHHQSPITSPFFVRRPCGYRCVSNVSSSPLARRVSFRSSHSNTSSVPQTTSDCRTAPIEIEKSSPSSHSGMISFKSFFRGRSHGSKRIFGRVMNISS